jgi:exonuclease VII small subunit
MINQKDDLSQSLKNLDEIVDWFENQVEVDVEQGLSQVKKGAQLISKIKKQLKTVENEFEEIKKSVD